MKVGQDAGAFYPPPACFAPILHPAVRMSTCFSCLCTQYDMLLMGICGLSCPFGREGGASQWQVSNATLAANEVKLTGTLGDVSACRSSTAKRPNERRLVEIHTSKDGRTERKKGLASIRSPRSGEPLDTWLAGPPPPTYILHSTVCACIRVTHVHTGNGRMSGIYGPPLL